MCGENADCKTENHRPICICPAGTTGFPQTGCYPIGSITTTTLEPQVLQPEIPSTVISPVASPAPPPAMPIPEFPLTTPAPPIHPDPEHHPAEKPVPVGCESNHDCSIDNIWQRQS